MHAATPRLYFQTLCQHEVFRVISTVNAGSLCTRQLLWQHDQCFFIFRKKRHKIVEFVALLPTELSSYKMCKVGMLFCTLQASISCKLQHRTFRESFLNVH